MSAARLRRPAAALLAGLLLVGCASWQVDEASGPPLEGRPRRVADRVLLSVGEDRLVWGDGQLGEGLRQNLLELGSFAEIDYPIVPRHPPPLRLRVEASGRSRESLAAGIAKSIFIGALFFLPVGILHFDRDYDADLTAELSRDGEVLQRVSARTSARLSFTMFADQAGGERRVREQVFQRLATELALSLEPVAPAP